MGFKTVNHAEVKKLVTDKLKGVLPPWVRGYALSLPSNALTGKTYRGNNFLLGMAIGSKTGSMVFATSDQWFKVAKRIKYWDKNPGGKILARDEDGSPAKPETFVWASVSDRAVKPEDADKVPAYLRSERGGVVYKKSFMYKLFGVYNLTQLDPKLQECYLASVKQDKAEVVLDKEYMEFLDTTGAKIKYAPGIPCYIPASDSIRLPKPEDFHSFGHFAATASHEVGHWTGAASRCDRELDTNFGSDPYATEEAIAEWVGLLLSHSFGFTESVERSASYIQNWTNRFEEQEGLLEETFKAAEQAMRFLNQYLPAEEVIEETAE